MRSFQDKICKCKRDKMNIYREFTSNIMTPVIDKITITCFQKCVTITITVKL